MFLGDTLKAEVRDAHLSHVATLHAQDPPLSVAPGLYHVSAVLDDGRRHSQVVAVSAEQESLVIFAESAAPSLASTLTPAPTAGEKLSVHRGGGLELGRYLESGLGELGGLISRSLQRELGWSIRSDVLFDWRGREHWTLGEVSGARLLSMSEDTCIFDAVAEELEEVPWVSLRVDGQERQLSLPVNCCGNGEAERACAVVMESHPQGPEPRAVIPRDRNVSAALQHMVAHGQIFQAHELIVEAADLLLYKYSDPVGAALGALVLYQTGALKDYSGWLANLTNDFAWMPDGKILSAALAVSEGDEASAAEYLLAAATQRPMFTLSFSIMIDLMRGFRGRRDDIQQALEERSDETARVDWRAFTFTVRGEEDE